MRTVQPLTRPTDQAKIRPGQHPVPVDRGHGESGHPDLHESIERGFDRLTAARGLPPVADGLSVTHVESGDHGVRTQTRDDRRSAIRIAEQRRPQGEPIGSGSEERPSRLQVADAAADLAGHARRGDDPRDEVELDRMAGDRTVEVDEMESLGPLGDPVAGHLLWVTAIRSLPPEIALAQSDHPAPTEVDGGYHLHGRAAS